MSDGSLWAWGDNSRGQLGLDDTGQRTSPIQVGTDNDWVAVACGEFHTLALKSDGSLWAWGRNSDGQIGDGTTDERHVPVVVPPVIRSLTSSTHPDQELYYKNNAPALAWTASDVTAVVGYSYVLDQAPDTVPDATIDITASSTSFAGLADGVWYFHLCACNQAGIWSATTTYTIRIDTGDHVPPVTTDNTDALWHQRFVLELTASDNDPGLVTTQYRIDGGPWHSGTSCVLHTPFRHHPGGLTNGAHTVEFFSTDAAGNSEAIVSRTVLLDHRAPFTYDDAPPEVQTEDVTVHLTASDALSGVSHTYYSLDGGPWLEGTEVVVAAPADDSGDGAHTIWYYSTDNAGNVEHWHSCTVITDAPWG